MATTNVLNLNADPRSGRFKMEMQAFADWRAALLKTIQGFHGWISQHELTSPEIELRLYDALQALESDRLSLAFVAEFSRGKTELINAIFFADYGRRLLPSEVGRTTMCPTELFFDHESGESYIKLLPIETRLSDISLSELKNEDSYWTRLPLDVEVPEQMVATFREIVKTKEVTVEEAENLGLFHASGASETEGSDPDRRVEIPVWRHAIISFPHPLLKQGLVILDTPGLNALGSEPELTLNMLPSAQAVLFVLSADTGVTRSDLDMWQNHIMSCRRNQQQGLLAVLNKIDTLWDEMKEPGEIEASITEQCRATANLLGIDEQSVFPVSAQKALVAKIRGNQELLERSKLSALEGLLASEILPARQHILWDNIASGLDHLIDELLTPLLAQLEDTKTQMQELSSLRGSNEEVVQQLLQKAKEKKASYYECVKSFQLSRRKLALQAKTMFNTLDIEAIDALIEKTRREMSGSWTTVGMKNGMAVFFDSMRDAMQIVSRQAEETHKLVQSIYHKFQTEYGLHVAAPRPFPIKRYSDELDRLYLKSEEFRNSTFATISEQHFVVKKFFISLVSHARNLFLETHKETDLWLRELVTPLVQQIQDKRRGIEQHMKTLSKIRESKKNLEGQLTDLRQQCETLQTKAQALERFKRELRACQPAPRNTSPAPKNKPQKATSK